jgi:hypothetical protein
MAQRRPTNSELRLRRATAVEPEPDAKGILEIFDDPEELPDADAPLARAEDDPEAE